MRINPRADEIRDFVERIFDELGADDAALADLGETILIDGGKCLGRSYRTDDFFAMWLIDVGILQFYDAEGNMLRTVNLFEDLHPVRMAA
jgi:hypothetical protein